LGLCGAAILAFPAAASPPANDNFGASIVISGDSGSLAATTAEATTELGEPFHAGEPGGTSVWYSLVASAGEYAFETCGSTTDTLLAVYSGDSFATLSSEGASDDACGTGSRVVLGTVTAGAVLRIAVDDANGLGGPFILAWKRTDHAPVNTSPPTVAGSPVEGQTLTAQPGTWTARRTPSYSYRWERCDASGAACAPAVGREPTLTLAARDVGRTFRAKVTARTSDGSTEATSALTPPIRALPPRNTSPPEIAGTARVGEELFVTWAGAWEGAETLFRYGWQRCTPNRATCTDIPGATEEMLVLRSAELGSVVRVVLTAANSGGTASAHSAPSGLVRPALPKPCIVPRLRGKTLVASRRALLRAGCSLGKVRRSHGVVRKGRVSGQTARPGRRLKPRARVGVVVSLGRRR
jgi:hypothetical protein